MSEPKTDGLEQTKEQRPDERRSRLGESTIQDIRFGARVLRRNPGFAAVALLTLALGIGATSAIFSLVNTVLLRPLPYKDPDRIVQIQGRTLTRVNRPRAAKNADWLDWKEDYGKSFESIGACNPFGGGVNLTDDGEAERVEATEISSGFLPTMGISPLLGRNFRPSDELNPTAEVALISYGLWQRRFGGDPKLVGRSIQINDKPFTITGIVPTGLEFPTKVDVWLPIASVGTSLISGPIIYYTLVARLKPDVAIAQARAEMVLFANHLMRENPNPGGSPIRITVLPLLDSMVKKTKPALLILLGAVGFVLLIACANVTNLLLARANSRRRELAVRAAVGASRSRLIRQMLAESILLWLLGGALGLAVAVGAMRVLLWLTPAGEIPRIKDLGELGVDGRVFAFALLVSLVTGVLFGLAPALQLSKFDLNRSLKDGAGHNKSGRGLLSLKGLLVVAELALALTLMIGAGLLIRSFARILDVDSGFDARNTLSVPIDLNSARYSQVNRQTDFFRQAVERMKRLPGVEFVGATNNLPLGNRLGAYFTFSVEGRPDDNSNSNLSGMYTAINDDYFRAMGTPIIEGRQFTSQDTKTSAPVVIINRSLATRLWPNESALGKRLNLEEKAPREIVGVVADTRNFGPESEPARVTYVPYEQARQAPSMLVLRTSGDPQQLVNSIREQIGALDRALPLHDIKTMNERLALDLAHRRFTLILLGVFAGLATLLAGIGIYGVMAYTITQRTHEIGIRVALGAMPADVLKMVLRQAMTLVAVGLAVGLGAAVGLTRLMAGLLYGVGATDRGAFVIAAVVVAFAALIACYVPARRAMRVDPIIALRYD